MKQFVEIEEQFQKVEHPAIPQDMKERILQSIRSSDETPPVRKARKKSMHLGSWMTGVAAVFVAGLAGVEVMHQSKSDTSGSSQIVTNAGAPTPVPPTSVVSNNLATKVQIATKSIHTDGMDVLYPELGGLPDTSIQTAINQKIKLSAVPGDTSQGTSGADQFRVNYQITYQRGNLVDFVITTQDSLGHADGGQTTQKSIIFNLATGEQYAMTDLFKPGSDYLDKLSTLVKSADTQHVLGVGMPFPTVKDSDTFVLTDDGFAVVFQQNEWTSHAAGTPAFRLRLSDVSGVINTSGSFWTAIQDGDKGKEASQISKDVQYLDSQGFLPAVNVPNPYGLNPYQVIQVPSNSQDPIYAFIGVSKKSNPAEPWNPIEQVFFFHGTTFLKSDTPKPHGLVASIYPDSNSSIAVDYQGSGTTFTIHYTWDGTHINPSSTFPESYTDWH